MSDRVRAIEPGSIPYGERQGVEEALIQQGPAAEGPTPVGGPGGVQPAPPEEANIDPEAILGGGPVSDLPITSGLSHGPGPGPMQGFAATSEQQKLQELAMNADSAGLRYMATLALRRIHARNSIRR